MRYGSSKLLDRFHFTLTRLLEMESISRKLQVAAYNHVSRRDPSDPHVPVPIVTHLAVGKDGRDMVTVIAVWTENSGVGAGPRGTSMKACTFLKFWTYVYQPSRRGRLDRRRRQSGDMPMAYELVSSMVAPHGRDGIVSALSVSPDGKLAYTLSREEGATDATLLTSVALDNGSQESKGVIRSADFLTGATMPCS